MSIPYNMTNESVTVVIDGQTHSVRRGEDSFDAVRKAVVNEDWEAIPKLVVPGVAVEAWLKAVTDAGFTYNRKDHCLYYESERLPEKLSRRAMAIYESGQDATYLLRFWERLQRNPSYRSVNQLYGFLENEGIPIDRNGFILAYKSVRRNYKDHHSNKFDNTPGVIQRMPRNKISDDPNVACHEGFHVGALKYAQSFGGEGRRIVVCRVDPEHVVCVPYDHNQRKVRVCEYEVVGNHGDQLPDLVVEDLEVEVEAREPQNVVEDGDAAEETATPAEKADKTLVPAREATEWDYLIDTPDGELMDKNLQHLRRYARHHLQIIRASKMLGGKEALVKRIIEVRRTPVEDD